MIFARWERESRGVIEPVSVGALVYLWEWDVRDRGELSSEERAIAQKIREKPHRETYVTTRLAVRNAVRGLTGCAVDEVCIKRTALGKPYVAGRPDVHLSISHSGREIMVVVARVPVGVDIEGGTRERRWVEIARRYFAAKDAEAVEQAAVAEQKEAFLQQWVAKEAALKSLGVGLAGYLERAQCVRDANAIVGVRIGDGIVKVTGFGTPAGTLGALACEVPTNSIRWILVE